METLNVVVAWGLEDALLEQIATVDPRIRLWNVANERFRRAMGLRHAVMEAEDGGGETMEELVSILSQAEVLLTHSFPRRLLPEPSRVKWVHFIGTGVERFLAKGGRLLESGIIFTNSRGISAIPIAEHVLGNMLMFSMQANRLFANKQNRLWEPFVHSELHGKTVGIVGLGAIGKTVARLGKAFGMRTLATRRSATKRASDVEGVDELFPPTQLLEIMAASDFVVNCAPLTSQTTRMIGEPQLRAMKPNAYLISISRGGVVDEPVLIRALKEGWIAGAGLDVFEQEPLPPDSELWGLPNVVLSSHNSGVSEMHGRRVVDSFCENLRRYLAGEELLNIITAEKGY